MSENTKDKTCSMCGLCCKLFLINLNESEYLTGDYKTVFYDMGVFEDFSTAEEVGANILQTHSDGSCIYLESGKCSIHESRPAVCRDFFCKDNNKKFKSMREIIESARK